MLTKEPFEGGPCPGADTSELVPWKETLVPIELDATMAQTQNHSPLTSRRRSSFSDLYLETKGALLSASISFHEAPNLDSTKGLYVQEVEYGELDVQESPVLAHGSMRAVWNRPCAPDQARITVLVMPVLGHSVLSKIRMFERLGRSSHPHICRLLGTTTKPQTLQECMVMEFADRGSLDFMLRDITVRGQTSPSDAVLLTVASQVRHLSRPPLRALIQSSLITFCEPLLPWRVLT